MENSANYQYGSVTRELLFLLIFEILVRTMAIIITVTCSLVIKCIYSKMKKLRADKMFIVLKVVSATFLPVCFLSLNESTCETRKNVFYFTSKALFVLKKIKF